MLSAVHGLQRGGSMAHIEERDKLLARAVGALADVLDVPVLGEDPTEVIVGRLGVQIVNNQYPQVLQGQELARGEQ